MIDLLYYNSRDIPADNQVGKTRQNNGKSKSKARTEQQFSWADGLQSSQSVLARFGLGTGPRFASAPWAVETDEIETAESHPRAVLRPVSVTGPWTAGVDTWTTARMIKLNPIPFVSFPGRRT